MGLQILSTILLQGRYTASDNVSSEAVSPNLEGQVNFSTGSGSLQADAYYEEELSLGPAGTQTLDLQALTDAFGAALSFARVKGLFVLVDATSGGDLVLGGAGANGWVGPFGANTGVLHVRAGGQLSLMASDASGWAVSSSSHLFLLTNAASSGAAVTGKLVVIGSRE